MALRKMVLEFVPESGSPLESIPVQAVVMDTTLETGSSYSLSCVADGTVSLYFSTGGGIIGAGGHESVRKEAAAFIEAAAPYAARDAAPSEESPLPKSGVVRFNFVTPGGVRMFEAKEHDLGNNSHAASELFHKAHRVIAAVRFEDEKRQRESEYLIHLAASGNTKELDERLKEGGSPERTDKTGLTPLMAASFQGQPEAVALLLKAGAKIEARDKDGYTALIFASNAGKLDCARLLLEQGADANAPDNQSSTPVMFAAQHGFDGVVRLLLEHKADPYRKGAHGLSALDFTRQNGRRTTEALIQGFSK